MPSIACRFDDIILTPEFLADPYTVYHRMRNEAPVYWSDRFNAWMLTRYPDVKSILHDSRMNRANELVPSSAGCRIRHAWK